MLLLSFFVSHMNTWEGRYLTEIVNLLIAFISFLIVSVD